MRRIVRDRPAFEWEVAVKNADGSLLKDAKRVHLFVVVTHGYPASIGYWPKRAKHLIPIGEARKNGLGRWVPTEHYAPDEDFWVECWLLSHDGLRDPRGIAKHAAKVIDWPRLLWIDRLRRRWWACQRHAQRLEEALQSCRNYSIPTPKLAARVAKIKQVARKTLDTLSHEEVLEVIDCRAWPASA